MTLPLLSENRSLSRVLFVDDDPAALRAFARSVAGTFELDTTGDPERALSLGRDQQYAVVATALRMPKFTGLELVDQLREERPSTSFVLVAGSSELDLSYRKDTSRYIAGVVPKPWSDDHLLATLTRAAQLYQTRVQSQRAPRIRVLLVEDSELDAALTMEMLDQQGYAVEHYTLLKDGERALESGRFDVALTDLSLPDACGLDAVSALRATSDAVPVVVMTGSIDEALARQVTHAGAHGLLVKNGLNALSLSVAIQCAFERQARESDLASRALHDPLTDLANRNALREAFGRSRARASRHGNALSLMLIDLDGFKDVNDRHGHLVGDQVLCGISRALEGAVRDSDLVARIGGDEFIVLADDIAPGDEETRFRDRIVRALGRPVRVGVLSFSMTACVGTARYPEHGEDLEALIRAADDSMYRNKAARRFR